MTMAPAVSRLILQYSWAVACLPNIPQHGAVFYTNATDEASAGRILARSLISAPLDKAHGDQSQWIYFDDLTTVDQADLMLLTSGPVNGTSAPPQNNLPLPLDLLSAHIDDASKGQRSADTYSLHSPWLERRSDEAMGTSSVHEAFIPPIMETEEEYGGALKRADNTAPSLPLFVDSGLMPPEAFQSTGQLSHQAFVVESESKETATSQAMEEQSQREVGYIVGSAYSGPEFRLQETPAFEKPPVFAMQNITLLPDQYRKPIAAALRSFTARMQEAAVEYCKKNHLNCTQEEALHTAISVAIRTSPVASMFRQISASLSALECTQHFTLRQPYNLDGDYTVVSSSGGVLEFEKKVSNDSLQPIASSWKLYLYQPASHPDVKGPLKSAVVACSPLPVTDATTGPIAYMQEAALASLTSTDRDMSQCRSAATFAFPQCLLNGLGHWRFTELRSGTSDENTNDFPAIVSVSEQPLQFELKLLLIMLGFH
ncbi:hypothetical protein cyc_08031 [Cyclospora cayetanensis]|uniref:Uncharacterized protein n=1 Tax=Cyclospora cayetanensis TaxID=88456 RepID=A0A1D3D2L2_9EIME|nr:hypothetical protein cyc_08031 [Cyclospora cayetanensis]